MTYPSDITTFILRRAWPLVFAFASALPAQTSGYVFTTLAGRSLLGGIDGPGDQASFSQPFGLAVDNEGNIYVADTSNQTIRRITPDHVVSTYVGQPGFAGATDAVGFAAQFNYPRAVAVDSSGTLYVTDGQSHTIRRITPDRRVTTFAGLAGAPGAADGTGAAARFYGPDGIAVDRNGNLYVADSVNATIRKITPAGAVSTLAGLAGVPGTADGAGAAARFIQPSGIAVDAAGSVYVCDFSASTIRAITPEGVVTTIAGLANAAGAVDGPGADARFFFPAGIAVDAGGNLYVGEFKNGTIRKITPDHVVSTLAGDVNVSGSEDGVGRAAHFYEPAGVALAANGHLFVAETGNSSIREVTPDGVVSTVAGQRGSGGAVDGVGAAARFHDPVSVTADINGNLYVADAISRTIRKVTPDGAVTTIAGRAGERGNVDGQGAAARFGFPQGVVTDAAGNIYVADGDNFTIRRITPDGFVSTWAGQPGNPGWADGPANTAQFTEPAALAIDGSGNIFVADRLGATVRKITPAGVVSTYAGHGGMPGSVDGPADTARLSGPMSVAVDRAGNVYVGDFNGTVRRIAPDRVVSTIAGKAGERRATDGPALDARFGSVDGLAIDPLGNLFVADATAEEIRRIDPNGRVTTIAGALGTYGGTDGSDGSARFNYPTAVALDSFGNLYVADSGNNTIRKAVSTTRLVNLSVRTRVGTGDQTLIVGFVVAGADPKPVLIRGVGPTLANLGVPTAVADPEFKVYAADGRAIFANDNWGGDASLSARFDALGAFPLDAQSKDAAVYAALAPGVYTTHINGVDGAAGVALAELYDGDAHVDTRLVNVSARATARSGDDTLIAGFVLAGAAPKTVLLRAVGPSLASHGVAGATVLADPHLTLFRGTTVIATNEDWGGAAALKTAAGAVGAFGLDADASKDAALLVTLDPGVYSAHVTGANSTAGVALVEVYEVP